MSWVDAAHVVRAFLGLAKRRRREPPYAESEQPEPQADQMWHNIISQEAIKLAGHRSLMADLARRDPTRAAIAGVIGKMTESEKTRARESMYRVAAEAYANGDMSWEEFKPYRKAHERKRQSGWSAK